MTTIGEDVHRTGAGRRPWGLIVTTMLFTFGTITLVWFAAVPWGPVVCPAISPAPANCVAGNRAGTGLVVTVVVAAIGVVTVALALLRVRASRARAIGGRPAHEPGSDRDPPRPPCPGEDHSPRRPSPSVTSQDRNSSQ